MFQYKGIRIRNRHKYASERFIFYLMLPVLLLMSGFFLSFIQRSHGNGAVFIG